MGFLGFEDGFDFQKLGFQFGVFKWFDDLGRGADYGAQEFFFGDLFEVGEAEFGEEFLFTSLVAFSTGWKVMDGVKEGGRWRE